MARLVSTFQILGSEVSSRHIGVLKGCPADSSIKTDISGFLREGIGFEPSLFPWPFKNRARI